MGDKWYHSDVGEGIGRSILLVGVGIGLGFVIRSCNDGCARLEESTHNYQIRTADVNNNGIPDKFYTIDDWITVVELDGRPVSELYLRRPSK